MKSYLLLLISTAANADSYKVEYLGYTPPPLEKLGNKLKQLSAGEYNYSLHFVKSKDGVVSYPKGDGILLKSKNGK